MLCTKARGVDPGGPAVLSLLFICATVIYATFRGLSDFLWQRTPKSDKLPALFKTQRPCLRQRYYSPHKERRRQMPRSSATNSCFGQDLYGSWQRVCIPGYHWVYGFCARLRALSGKKWIIPVPRKSSCQDYSPRNYGRNLSAGNNTVRNSFACLIGTSDMALSLERLSLTPASDWNGRQLAWFATPVIERNRIGIISL